MSATQGPLLATDPRGEHVAHRDVFVDLVDATRVRGHRALVAVVGLGGSATPHQASLRMHVTRQRAEQLLEDLAARGLVDVQRTGPGRGDVYTIAPAAARLVEGSTT